MADLREPGRLGLVLRGAQVVVVFLGVAGLGGWLLYGLVQVFSSSFHFGPRPVAAPPPPLTPSHPVSPRP